MKLEKAQEEYKEAEEEIKKLKEENAAMAPITFKSESKDERFVYYSQIIGGEKNMSDRVSDIRMALQRLPEETYSSRGRIVPNYFCPLGQRHSLWT